jgi:hypothetical protein
MNRTEALKALRLSATADGHAVEQAYWSLVRRAQAGKGASSQREIDRLNEAYAILAPEPEPMARTAGRHGAVARQQPVPPTTVVFPGDAVLDWFGDEALRVRRRWSGRNPEISIICGAGLVLVVMALMAGATVIPVLICVALIAAAVWAPWRRAGPPSDRED